MAEQTVVVLGNATPQMLRVSDGRVVGSYQAEHINQSETRVAMWTGFDDEDFVQLSLATDNDRVLSLIAQSLADADKRYAVGLSELEHVVNGHMGTNGKPAWVACSDAEFARVIGEHFGCPVARPTAYLTLDGRDALHAQHLSPSAQPAGFNYMALGASGTASASNSTVPGEIATTGLARAQGTYAHTAGTNNSTLTKTFTAQAADVAGGTVTATQMGVLNAATGGTLGYNSPLSSPVPFASAGDNLTLTETVTAG